MNVPQFCQSALWQLTRFGWAGATGLVLCSGAVVFSYVDQQHSAQQMQSLRNARNQLAQDRTRQRGAQPDEQAVLARFKDRLATADSLPDLLISLDTAAKRAGVLINRADYTIKAGGLAKPDKADQSPPTSADVHNQDIKTIRISLPLKGSYAAIRTWLSDVQSITPPLHIESIDFQRQKISDSDIDAQVRLILYAKGDQ
jgi:Tfp pilus assembly protein PilO